MTKPNGKARLEAWRQAAPASSYTGQAVDGATLCWVCRLRGLVELATVCNVETHSPFCASHWTQHAEERARADLVPVDAAELAQALEADAKRSRRRRRQKEKAEP
jgi:DNA primase